MKPLKLVASLSISFSAAALGSIATVHNIPIWYAALDKPFFNPPNWVFGPVWTVLYALVGVSLYLVWTGKTDGNARLAYTVYGTQLALNALWSIVFFGLHQPEFALIIIISLIVATTYTMKLFRPYSKLAGNLLIPYLAWISFAMCLNLAIAILN